MTAAAPLLSEGRAACRKPGKTPIPGGRIAARDCARNDAGVARELARRAVYAAASGREELAEPLAALYEPAVD